MSQQRERVRELAWMLGAIYEEHRGGRLTDYKPAASVKAQSAGLN